MIKGNSIKKDFGTTTLLSNLNFHIKSGEKIALIGRNGTGKTTLFKIIIGEEQPTEGTITLENENIGYLTQEFNFFSATLVGEFYEEVGKNNNDVWRVVKIAGQLGLQLDEYQAIETLSGGEKMRLKLTELLYHNPTTLLLDEPTNHLDIKGIQWLKKFLKQFAGSVIMISHDRDLINDTVDKIYEIDEQKILEFNGNYNDYVEKKQNWIEKRSLEYNRFLERKKKLEIMLDKAQKGIIRSRSGNATEAVKKRIEREVTKREVKNYDRKEYADFEIDGNVHDTKLVLRVNNAAKSYGEKNVLKEIDFEMRGGEKIWLFGENGMGKSTVVKCILGLETLDNGYIKVGENINIGYFEQKQKPLEIEDRLIDYYVKNTTTDYYSVPKVLARYLFTEEDMYKSVRLLSPGQQARLKFALFAESSSRQQYQFLVLDEPAQHLDIETKEVVERAINSFKGAILLISHDLYSIQNIEINRGVELIDGELSY